MTNRRITDNCWLCATDLFGDDDGIIYYRMGKENIPLCLQCWENKRSNVQ